MLNVLTSLPAKKICGRGLSLAVFSRWQVMRRMRIKNVAVPRVVFSRFQASYVRNIVRRGFRVPLTEHHFFIKQKTEQPDGSSRYDPCWPGLQTGEAVEQPHTRYVQCHADQNARYEQESQGVYVAAPGRPENPFALQPESHRSPYEPSDYRCRHGQYPQVGERHVKTRKIRRRGEHRRGAVLAQQSNRTFNTLENSAFAY